MCIYIYTCLNSNHYAGSNFNFQGVTWASTCGIHIGQLHHLDLVVFYLLDTWQWDHKRKQTELANLAMGMPCHTILYPGVTLNHPFLDGIFRPTIWGYPHLWKPPYVSGGESGLDTSGVFGVSVALGVLENGGTRPRIQATTKTEDRTNHREVFKNWGYPQNHPLIIDKWIFH